MKKKSVWVAVFVALSVFGGNSALAQRVYEHNRRPAQRARAPQSHRRHAPVHPQQVRPPQNYSHYQSSQHRRSTHGDLRTGHAIPRYYNNRQYVVNDWSGHRLYTPPRGHHWIQVDGDYVLVAAATGIIAHILMGH